MHYTLYCFLFTTVLVGSEGRPSFMDAIPGVSQGKMSFLYIIGREDQARQTLANFKNLTHLWESVKNIDDSIPIYGHMKAFIVGINGDEERAKTIIEAAHTSTSIAGGFFVAGPIGGVAGSVFADSTMSIADWKAKGTIEHIAHLKNKTASENMDLVVDLTVSAMGKNIEKLPTESIGGQTIHLEMKKIPVSVSNTAPLASFEEDGLTENVGKNHMDNKKSSSKASLSAEANETLKIFVQPYTPYQQVPSPQNVKIDKEKKTVEIIK